MAGWYAKWSPKADLGETLAPYRYTGDDPPPDPAAAEAKERAKVHMWGTVLRGLGEAQERERKRDG